MDAEPVGPGEGLAALHLFCDAGPDVRAKDVLAAVEACQAADHQVVTFAVLGHKAQLGFLALGPDLWRLQSFQAALVDAGLLLVDSFVSLTEVSEYAAGMPEPALRERLYPRLPPAWARVVCFYPMSKRRGEGHNWYVLPFEERKELMHGHGRKARQYPGKVVQLVTGSTGLDDWEWGVTLFAQDPADLKGIVHQLRFDEASAHYAEFGPFVTGLLAPADEVLRRVGL